LLRNLTWQDGTDTFLSALQLLDSRVGDNFGHVRVAWKQKRNQLHLPNTRWPKSRQYKFAHSCHASPTHTHTHTHREKNRGTLTCTH